MIGLISLLLDGMQVVQSAAVSASVSSPQPKKRLVIFGDSFSDAGQGSWAVSGGRYPISPPYSSHRFSNGLMWPEIVANTKDLDLKNYAIGGATCDNSYVPNYWLYGNLNTTVPNPPALIPSTQDQINQYLQSNIPRASDIYVLFVGGNDVVFAPESNIVASATEVATRIENQVGQLYKWGVRNLIVASYLDTSVAPQSLAQPVATQQFMKQYFRDLRNAVSRIPGRWSGRLKIQFADVYTSFAALLANPASAGCDATLLKKSCYTGSMVAFDGTICTTPDKYIFWDALHVTRITQQRFASVFQDALEKL